MKYLKKLSSSIKDIIMFGNGKEMIKGNISKINIDISKWRLQL